MAPQLDEQGGIAGRLFGFKDLDQLRAWVYQQERRDRLADEGYVVYEVFASDVLVGDTQCIFNIVDEVRVVPWDEVSA